MRFLSFVFFVIGPVTAARAEAPRSTSSLSWVRLAGTESCIGAAELGTRIEAHLGRSIFVSPSTADVSIEGHVEPHGKRYLIVVGGTRRDGTAIGVRQIESEASDCRMLDQSLVLVMALMIDPDATAPPSSPPPSTREVIHERVVIHDVYPSPLHAASARSWHVDAHLDGTIAFARLPVVAPGLLVGVPAAETRRLREEARALPPRAPPMRAGATMATLRSKAHSPVSRIRGAAPAP